MPKTKFGSTSRSAFAHDPGAGKMAARDATTTTRKDRARNLLKHLGLPAEIMVSSGALKTAESALTMERYYIRGQARHGCPAPTNSDSRAKRLLSDLGLDATDSALQTVEHVFAHERILAREELRNAR
jgi:hypothetical protein